jgi:hypothetical protein
MDPTRTTSEPPPSPEAIAAGYEPMRLSGRSLFWFLAWFVIAMVLICALVWFVMKWMGSDVRPEVDRPQNVIEPSAVEVVGAPPLQPSTGHDVLPREDLARLREDEDQVFAHLGWTVDERTGLATVPESVIQAVARRAATRPASRPTTVPTAPRGGGGGG